MKVKELIELLSKLEQEKEIRIDDHYQQENFEFLESSISDWKDYYVIG